ncbi:MAG: toprim domain-containing protein [Gammaproteobacteria bacterium]|nr:toprim domain-containing protein [Gammaproteobacteria bacterium]
MTLYEQLSAHGIELRHDHTGTQRLPCPDCDKGARDTALAVTVEADGAAVWQCFRCGFKGATSGLVAHGERSQAPSPARIQHDTLADFWRGFWTECRPITTSSPAGRYLNGRGCVLPPEDGDLRWHPECRHPAERAAFPALIGLITDARTNTPTSLHRTYLRPDGAGKAEVKKPRLLIGQHRKAGGVIRLWPDEAVTHGLAIAEGIETALSAAHAYTPVWCCIDAGNLATFPVLDGIESLLIAADNDAAGMKAATQCESRWLAAGRDVALAAPPPGMDWNDEARAA